MAVGLGINVNTDKEGAEAQKVKTRIQEDYTRVDVYFQTLNVMSMIQSPTMPVWHMYIIFIFLHTF